MSPLQELRALQTPALLAPRGNPRVISSVILQLVLWPPHSLPRSPAVEVTHAEISRQQAAALSACAVQKSVRAPSLPVRAGSGIKSGESIMTRICNPSFPSANIHTSHQTPFHFPSGSVVCPKPTQQLNANTTFSQPPQQQPPYTWTRQQYSNASTNCNNNRYRVPMNHAAIPLSKATIPR